MEHTFYSYINIYLKILAARLRFFPERSLSRMKTPRNYLTLFTTLLLSLTTIAQHGKHASGTKVPDTPNAAAPNTPAFTIDTTYGDHADRHIYQLLRQGKADTIIRFDLPMNYTYDSLPDDGPASINVQFILHRSGNNTLIEKAFYISSCNYDLGPGIAAPVSIQNDTLFSWLHQQMDTIKTEVIAPLAVRYDHTHHPIYQIRWTNHPPYYAITLITRYKKVNKGVNTDDLDKTSYDNMINLNYEYNTGTKLYRLFQMLEERCKKTIQNKLPL